MNPDIKWLEALKLPLKSSLAGTVIAPAILLSIAKNWIDFGDKAELASTVLVIATIFFTVMSLVGIGELLLKPTVEKQKKKSIIDRRKIRRDEELAIRADNEIKILRRLDFLSEEELAVFAQQLQKNSATFLQLVSFTSPWVSKSERAHKRSARGLQPRPLSIHNS